MNDAFERRIVRVWHGTTRPEHREAYRKYVAETGLVAYREQPGNLGAMLLDRDAGDHAEFYTVSTWHGLEDIRAFAGEHIDRARYFPEDARFLLAFEPEVRHFDALIAGAAEMPLQQ